MEQPHEIVQRHNFLRMVRKYRREGCPIIYLGETRLNAHHSLTKCWIDSDGIGGLPVKSGKGGRVIILHAGWTVAGSLKHTWCFEEKQELAIIIMFYGMVFNKCSTSLHHST